MALEAHRFKITLAVLVLAAFFGSTLVFPALLLLIIADRCIRLGAVQPALMALRVAAASAANVGCGFYTIAGLSLKHICGIQIDVAAVVPGGYAQRKQSNCVVGLQEVLRPPPDGKTSVIVCNHRTRLDWMLLWIVLLRVPGALQALRIILKDELAKMPFFGWAMQTFRFVFLSRKWAVDEKRVEAAAQAWYVVGDGNLVLIFPEGTDLHDKAIEKSAAYAKERGLPEYKHVLYPRETGLLALLGHLGPSLHEVIDITMGYEDFEPGKVERPSEKSFFAGRITRKINVLIETFRFADQPPKTKPADAPVFYVGAPKDETVKSWLQRQFARKEEALEAYYTLPRAKDAGKPRGAPLDFSWMDVGYHLKLAPEANVFPTQDRGFVRTAPARLQFVGHVLTPLLWALGALWLLNGVLFASGVRTVVFFVMVVYAVETKVTGGIDHWLIFPTAGRIAKSIKAAAAGPSRPSPTAAKK